jgi:calcineurin-like phosphoesterase family protein
MLQTLKITAAPNEITFVSDLHWGHDREFLWGKRGFKSVQEHDDAMVHRWNEVSTNRTIALHLGDLCFMDGDGKRFHNLIRRLNFGTLYTLLGNHNSGVKVAYNEALKIQYPEAALLGAEVYPLSIHVDGDPLKKVVFLPEYVEANINGQRCTLCHFPIASHHKVGHGSWMCAGHSHSSLPMTNKDTGVGKRIDLGIESFGRPITFAELKRFMDARPTHSYDHHNSETN